MAAYCSCTFPNAPFHRIQQVAPGPLHTMLHSAHILAGGTGSKLAPPPGSTTPYSLGLHVREGDGKIYGDMEMSLVDSGVGPELSPF